MIGHAGCLSIFGRYRNESTHYRRPCPLVGGASLGALGPFDLPPVTPPISSFIAVVGPLVVFLAAYWGSARFVPSFWRSTVPWRRRSRLFGLGTVISATPRGVAGVRAGAGGLGDIAIGFIAAWVADTLARIPGFASHRLFVLWKLLAGSWTLS